MTAVLKNHVTIISWWSGKMVAVLPCMRGLRIGIAASSNLLIHMLLHRLHGFLVVSPRCPRVLYENLVSLSMISHTTSGNSRAIHFGRTSSLSGGESFLPQKTQVG